MIPPRSLVFSDGNVQWECREADAAPQDERLVMRKTDSLEHPKDLYTFFRDWRAPDDDGPEVQDFVMLTDLDTLRGEPHEYLPFLKAWLHHQAPHQRRRPVPRHELHRKHRAALDLHGPLLGRLVGLRL